MMLAYFDCGSSTNLMIIPDSPQMQSRHLTSPQWLGCTLIPALRWQHMLTAVETRAAASTAGQMD